MLDNTTRNRRLLAGVVGVNLSLALAIGAGAMSKPRDDGPVRAAAFSQVEESEAPAARQPGDTIPPVGQQAASTTAAPPTAPASPTTVARPRATTAPPTTKAPAAAPKATQPTGAPGAPATAAAPASPVKAAPVAVPRRTPSAAEVQGAITGLKTRVGGMLRYVSPTPDQIAQAGDQVCTAFDGGQSFAQVKATGLSMIPPSVTVTPATADWAVREAVRLYCPGHTPKLV